MVTGHTKQPGGKLNKYLFDCVGRVAPPLAPLLRLLFGNVVEAAILQQGFGDCVSRCDIVKQWYA